MVPSRLRSLRRLATVVVGVVLLVTTACGGDEGPAGDTSSSTPSTTTTLPRPPSAELTAITEVEDGSCFDTHSETSSMTRAVWIVPCAERHDYEVYSTFDYEGPEIGYRHPAYPGEKVIQDQAERRCYEGFEPFVGTRWTVSKLDIRTWWPSEASWLEGDRRILCAVTPTDRTPMTGSRRGSRE